MSVVGNAKRVFFKSLRFEAFGPGLISVGKELGGGPGLRSVGKELGGYYVLS